MTEAEQKAAIVSTHSRPKAAASHPGCPQIARQFQHTAARRRLLVIFGLIYLAFQVSTHSRPKAAAL